MTTAKTLLVCPFCGGECDANEVLVGHPDGTAHTEPGCVECSATTPTVEAWNRRAASPDTEAVALLRELVEAISEFDGTRLRYVVIAARAFLARPQHAAVDAREPDMQPLPGTFDNASDLIATLRAPEPDALAAARGHGWDEAINTASARIRRWAQVSDGLRSDRLEVIAADIATLRPDAPSR